MSKYRQTMSEALQKVYEQDKDHEISMARGELEAIADKATQLSSALQGKTDDGNPLEAWVQSKITKAKDYINSVSDYLMYNPEQAKEELEEGKMKTIATMFDQGKSAEEIAKALKLPIKTVKSILGEGINPYVSMQKDDKTGRTKYVVLDKDEKEAFSSFEYRVAQDYMKKNYNKLKEQLDEKVADSIIKDLQKAYGDLKGKTISPEMANKISKHLDGQSYDVVTLRQLTKAKIPFISTIARNKIYKKTGKFEAVEEPMPKEEPKKDNEQKESENKDKEIASLKDQISMLKQKLENEKNKAIKPEPNPETGEVPLTIGIAHAEFKKQKEKEVKEETLEEMSPAEKKKRLQRAKDMIKYYDMMKKRALKGPNKALAKKMLKSELEEATMVSDISGISIPALKRETAKFNIKVARVTPGGPMGAEYEVTFTGAEKDLIAYAKEHFGFDDKPGTFQQLKKHLNMDYVPESASQVQTRSDGKGNFNLMFRGKEIGYYHKERGKYVVYHSYDKRDKEYTQSDMVSTPDQAKKMAYDNMTEADLTKSQIKQVHKVADDLPKKDFKDRYGKEKGDAVRFGTATNMVKKKLGMKESKEQKLRNMKTVIDMLDGTHGRIIASKSDLQKLMNLTKKMNKLENPRGPSSSEKRDYENLVKKYSNQLGSKRNEYLGYLKDIMKEQTINEDRRLYVETIAGLKKKAEKSGMPYSILKKVYDRGMAAWKSGHRPGASQQQWAFARVNSFVTKSSGTWGGADKDLAKQVRGSK